MNKIEISDYFDFDKKIIRGFDYYTGLVFEAWPSSTLKRAIFGGGRYNNLTKTVGGKRELPGVGFAVGDAAMIEVLKEFNFLPEIRKLKILFIPLTEEAFIESKKYIAKLHAYNVIAQINNKIENKLKSTLKYAAKEKFNFVVIIGTDELSRGIVKVKNLYTFKEQEINNNDLISFFLGALK